MSVNDVEGLGSCKMDFDGYRVTRLVFDLALDWGGVDSDLRDDGVRKALSLGCGRLIDEALRSAVKEQEDAIKEKVEKIREEFFRRVLDGGSVPGV